MSHTYAGSSASFIANITLPDDTDARDASSVNVPLEALANRTAWLKPRSVTITQADSPYTITTAVRTIAVNHGAPVTILLPTAPAVGDEYEVMDVACVSTTHGITVDSGVGNIIQNATAAGAQTYVIGSATSGLDGGTCRFKCWSAGANKKWKLIGSGLT